MQLEDPYIQDDDDIIFDIYNQYDDQDDDQDEVDENFE